MYGKIFASLWTGSMRGKGDLQLVFAYMISNCTEDGMCDFVPQCIAEATGKPLDVVLACIAELEGADDLSRTKVDEGRRIRLIDPERQWGWQIVNHAMYRKIATRDAMKEAERLRKREYRDSKIKDCPGQVPDRPGTPDTDSESGVGVGVVTPREGLLGLYDKIRTCRPDYAKMREMDVVTLLSSNKDVDAVRRMVDGWCMEQANASAPMSNPIASLRKRMTALSAPAGNERPGHHNPYAACINLKVPQPEPGMEGWSE